MTTISDGTQLEPLRLTGEEVRSLHLALEHDPTLTPAKGLDLLREMRGGTLCRPLSHPNPENVL